MAHPTEVLHFLFSFFIFINNIWYFFDNQGSFKLFSSIIERKITNLIFHQYQIIKYVILMNKNMIFSPIFQLQAEHYLKIHWYENDSSTFNYFSFPLHAQCIT